MTKAIIRDNLIVQLDKLPPDLQLRVLDFVSALVPKGVAEKSLLKFEGAIPVEDFEVNVCGNGRRLRACRHQ